MLSIEKRNISRRKHKIESIRNEGRLKRTRWNRALNNTQENKKKHIDGQTDRQTDRQAYRHRHRDKQIDRHRPCR